MSLPDLRVSRTAMIVAFAGLAAACNQNPGGASNNVADAANLAAAPAPVATIPLTDTPTTAPLPVAPPVSQLPPYRIRRAAVANPADQYAFIERANRVRYGFGDAPPDYSFSYGGESPWAWQSDNGYAMMAEPLPGGAERYYYYAPGDDAPYFISDPDYGYGYQDGVLIVIYDNRGRPLPPAAIAGRWDDGGRYWLRGQQMRIAARGAHYGVPRAYWSQQRESFHNEEASWNRQMAANPDWSAYNAQVGPQYNQQWGQERWRRESEAYRYDQAFNDGARAQRDHDEALAAAGAAGLAGGVIAGRLLGHHDGPPGPVALPAGQFAGPSQPLAAPAAPGLANQRYAAAQAAQQASAQGLATARQAEAQLQAQHQALLVQQRQLAAQHAQLQAEARAAASAEAAAQAKAQTQAIEQQQTALRARQAAAAQEAAQAHQAQILAARQAEFRAEEARVAQIEAQKEAAAAQRAQQAAAVTQARQAQAAQAHQAQLQSQQARAAQAQAQEQSARQAQAAAAQRTQATQATQAADRARAAEESTVRRPEARPQPQVAGRPQPQ